MDILIGDVLKSIRKCSGITQAKFAKEIHVSQSYISKLEKNEINLPIQINGKMKKTILVDANIDDEMKIVDMIKEEYPGMISGDIKKVIYIKGKIINIIL